MPINRRDYSPIWPWISYYIRHYRGKNRCEECSIENHTLYALQKEYTLPIFGDAGQTVTGKEVILTVAHLDGNTKNNEFRNLRCLCQKCHLNYDREANINKKKYGRRKNSGQLPIHDL